MTHHLGLHKGQVIGARGVLNLLSVPRRYTNIQEYLRVPLNRKTQELP